MLVANKCLIWFQAHSARTSYSKLFGWPKTRDWITQRSRVKQNTTDLKKKKVNIKWFIMICCYTHRWVPYSIIIKEASFWRRWAQIKGTTARHYEERDLNIKPGTRNLRDEKVGDSLELIGTRDDFLHRTQIAQLLRTTINKWYLMKLKIFCKAKDTIIQTK